MRHLSIILLLAFLIAPSLAIEQPGNYQDSKAYPVATIQGLDSLQLGLPLPSKCTFKGLTFKTTSEPDYDELGRATKRTTVKIYLNGFFVGHGLADKNNRLVELELTDWRIAFEGNFAANSTWEHLKTQLPEVKLHYADMLDAVVAESPDFPGLQVHFAPSSYKQKSALKGEFTKLSPALLPPSARAEKLRIFWIPTE